MSRTVSRAALAASAAGLVIALAACAAPSTGPTTSTTTATAAPLATYTDGVLTIATGEPAYPPYVIDDDPTNGEGFEAAVGYAVAEQLGFSADEVVWVRASFDQTIAPGPKPYDFNLQQVSITEKRAQAVDFSSSYYDANQAVVTVAGSPADGATTIADLQDVRIGVAVGTTSLDAVETVIQPTTDAQVFNNNDDAVTALNNGQVDAIVVDLPTAYYMTAVQVKKGVIVGQLEGTTGADSWGLVLEKGSPLTEPVTAAVDALRDDGTLDALADEWMGGESAPTLG